MKLLVDLAVVFIILCGGASLVASAIHSLGRGLVERLTPDARARFRVALLFAPLVVGLAGVTAALLPSLVHFAGIANDHCLAPNAHGHAHLCFVHQPQGTSPELGAVVAVLGALLLSRMGLVLFRAARAHRAFGAIIASSRVTRLRSGVLEFDSEIPACLTLGIFTPQVYISSGAVDALGPECVEAALAHEQGHLARHETRLRLAARIGAAFHLPGFAESILNHWLHDSELICDRHAARVSGSAAVVADALVRFHRAHRRLRAPRMSAGACLCADGSRLNARVTSLLALDVRALAAPESEGRVAYLLGFGLLAVGLALQARHLHHALESLVGFLAVAPH